jgi:hypothetical protein
MITVVQVVCQACRAWFLHNSELVAFRIWGNGTVDVDLGIVSDEDRDWTVLVCGLAIFGGFTCLRDRQSSIVFAVFIGCDLVV